MRFYKQYFLILFSLLAVSPGCKKSADTQNQNAAGQESIKSDAKALAVVDEMWQALGGKQNWQNTRYLSFHWKAERDGNLVAHYRHDWDRHTNRYRVEGTDRQGRHFVALFDTKTKLGDVYLKGSKMPEDSTKIQMLERAYQRFINDSYWLIMPYKLNDPGVILKYGGERQVAEKTYDVIEITFENVGLTPGDTYWAFIDKADRLMHKWEYVLQNRQPPPTVVWWQDWQSFDGIKLALNRKIENRPARIYFEDVKVSTLVDEAVFQMTTKTF